MTWGDQLLGCLSEPGFATDLLFLSGCTGCIENWARGQLLLAARDGALGSGGEVVRAERDGRIDLLVGDRAAELKLIFNNKNLLGRSAVGGVRADMQKLRARTGTDSAVAAIFVFHDRRRLDLPKSYCPTIDGVRLQPQNASQDFGEFSSRLSHTCVNHILPRGCHRRPVKPLQVPTDSPIWLGVWVHEVR